MNNTFWNNYPRPQMRRDNYMILGDNWKLNGHAINMPYPPQSRISGYNGQVFDELVYEAVFKVKDNIQNKRLLLHFGAVDQVAKVWINDIYVGEHTGGYLPFYFDVTGHIKDNDLNRLKVEVTDTLDADLPYGKQTKKPGGMWYTPVSGIWQTVWMEMVPEKYIEEVVLTPSLTSINVKLKSKTKVESFTAIIQLENGESMECCYEGNSANIDIPNPIHWTPDNPYLYSMRIVAGEDRFDTYFALRTIEIKNIDGVQRVCLSGKPIFFHGVLDQGYYEDGIYLPEDEDEYERDILRMKELGFNMLRKHIKVEPEYFYYLCDKHGMLVMQDMVNTGKYSFIKDTALPTVGFKKKNDKKTKITKAMTGFEAHAKETIAKLYNHPCIVAYTIFNEGWGQFNSDEMYDKVKLWDETRLVDSTSGWYAQKKNDFDSEHIYFKTKTLKVKGRPLFVTECGGYKLFLKEHFFGRKEYGYGTCADENDLTGRIEKMYEKMIIPGISQGVCGCIYTQLSDVEDEINGLYTYDRKVCKVDKDRMREIVNKINSCFPFAFVVY